MTSDQAEQIIEMIEEDNHMQQGLLDVLLEKILSVDKKEDETGNACAE